MSILLIVLLVVLLFGGIGTFPAWDHSRGYGYAPSGLIGALFIILLVWVLLGHGRV